MNLTLPLKRKWFEAIQEGTKTEEYRMCNDYWSKRLVGKTFKNIILTLGYPKREDNEKRIITPYRGYIVKTVICEEWDNIPQLVFVIPLTDNFVNQVDP